jgi:hypothetical protein
MKIYEAMRVGDASKGYWKGLVSVGNDTYMMVIVHESRITEFAEHTAWGLRPRGDGDGYE